MSERVLELARVTKRFAPVTALDDVSLAVRPGEVFGLVGGSGAGKTTATRLMAGVLVADSGRVLFGGAALTRRTRARIGYLPQHGGLYPTMTVLDHLVLLARLHGRSADEAHRDAHSWLDRLGIAGHAEVAVRRLDPDLRQRARLAAALVHRPEAVVLDDPSAGLGPRPVDVLRRVVHGAVEDGAAVVWADRRLDLVERLCERVGILRSGRTVAQGSVAELTAAVAPRVSVTVDGADPAWAHRVPKVRVLADHGPCPNGTMTTVVELGQGTDGQDVLTAALAAGAVRDFRRYLPSLAERYREVLDDPATEHGGHTGRHGEHATRRHAPAEPTGSEPGDGTTTPAGALG